MVSMASLGFEYKAPDGKVQNGEVFMNGFSPTVKFHGNCYNRLPSLHNGPGQPKKFAQWYIHDGTMAAEEEAKGRINSVKNPKKYKLE